MLVDTELPIAEIAARLQYADTPAFCRAFHRRSGLTATAFRAVRQED
jgi:AraC-like DNA-binding protein